MHAWHGVTASLDGTRFYLADNSNVLLETLGDISDCSIANNPNAQLTCPIPGNPSINGRAHVNNSRFSRKLISFSCFTMLFSSKIVADDEKWVFKGEIVVFSLLPAVVDHCSS